MSDFNAYLTFEEYQELGGQVDLSAFPLLVRRAQRELDSYTFDRLKEADTIIDEVKEVLTLMIDMLAEDSNGDEVKSFSNGKVNFTFADKKSVDERMHEVAVKYLPVSLISGVVS
jgi:hypothetical protein